MEIGDKVTTPDGKGIIKSIQGKSILVLINSKTKRYDSNKISMIYDPISKLAKNETSNHLHFVLGMDAHRLYAEYRFNPYVLATSTKIKIFPHQINEVMWGLENSRILIADEVGLGKTIISALIVSELRARGIAKRLLFVVPKSLQIKWKNELEERFDIPTTILNNDYMKYHTDPFTSEFSFVASIDYLKQDSVISRLTEEFDIVIIDEAHKMKKKTARLALGKHLAAKTNHLMLLTATPHDGDDEDFMERLKLLDSFVTSINTASHLWTRTIKEHVIDIEGKPVFPKRTSETIKIPLKNKELHIMKLLENYFDFISSNATTPQEVNMIRFLRHIYRKRASSSLTSLEISLKRRITKLSTNDFDISKIQSQMLEDDFELEDVQGYDGFSVSDIEEEKKLLEEIVSHLNSLDYDSKLDKLQESIQKLKTDMPDAKLVVFTEYRDTLDYLAKSLEYKTGKIDGTMSITERQEALERFKDPKGDEIIICTDAAGEGIDMQFCNVEINYDLPWNPNRLEQRMGRIHRIGQDQNVFYYNFVVDPESTIDGYIMNKLLEKIEQIKRAIGDKVYDIIGMLIDSEDLGRYYDELREIPKDRWEPKVSAQLATIESNRRDVLKKREKLLEGNRLDTTNIEDISKIRDHSVIIDEVKRFLQVFVEMTGGRMDPIDSIKNKYKIRLSERLSKELDIGEMIGTFDPSIAEKESIPYLALGNKNIEKILWNASSDHVAALSHESQDGILCVYKVTIIDFNLQQRSSKIIAIFEHSDGEIHQVDERSVWTYDESDKKINIDFVTSAIKRITPFINNLAEKEKQRTDNTLNKIKDRTISIRKEHYIRKAETIDSRIVELEKENTSPYVEKIIKAQQAKVANLQKKLDADTKTISRQFETNMKIDLIGIAQVTPKSDADIRIRIDEAGMRAVLEFEKNRAANNTHYEQIVDCSKRNCGYDVESFDRKIEVKSHKKSGSIMLTDHEWNTAIRLQDQYWLYIVEDVFDSPAITCKQNPAKLYQNSIEKIPQEQFRWIVYDWK